MMNMRNVHLLSIILASFLTSSVVVLVSSQTTWEGCINTKLNRNQRLVSIQQPTRICISIANDTNWNSGSTSYIRAAFEPNADVYSRFHIPNSYRDLVQRKNATGSIFSDSTHITISAASQTALSFVRVYYDSTKDRIYPFLTAIMDVERGVVKGITWDNACVFCGGTECVENTYNYNGDIQNQKSAQQNTRSCFVTTEDCNALLSSNSSSTICDITLYTVWTGTDRNGIALQSQAYRFSEFPPQELSDRITQFLVPDATVDFINGENNGNSSNSRLLFSSSSSSFITNGASIVQKVMEDHYQQQSQQSGSAAIINEEGDL